MTPPPVGQEHVEEIRFLRACLTHSQARLEAKIDRAIRLFKANLSILPRGRPRHSNITRGKEMRYPKFVTEPLDSAIFDVESGASLVFAIGLFRKSDVVQTYPLEATPGG